MDPRLPLGSPYSNQKGETMICPRCGSTHVPAAKQPVTVAVCDACLTRDTLHVVAPPTPKRRRKPRTQKGS